MMRTIEKNDSLLSGIIAEPHEKRTSGIKLDFEITICIPYNARVPYTEINSSEATTRALKAKARRVLCCTIHLFMRPSVSTLSSSAPL